jgi:hypothetical protein
LRQNEPQGRNADDQRSNQYDDQAHLITLPLSAQAATALILFT